MAGVIKFTEEDRAAMIAMYESGVTRLKIADAFDCSLNTVTRALEGHLKTDARGNVSSSNRLTPEQKEEIIQLYLEGYKLEQIAKLYDKYPSSIRTVLLRGGVLKEKEEPASLKTLGMINRLGEAIMTADIECVRKKIKVGDKLTVMTKKCGDMEHTTSSLRRKAVVVDTSHPRFVVVKLLKTGILESFLWSDLVITERKKTATET